MAGANFKQGWSTVGGKTCWFRSGLEVRWARYLEFLKGINIVVEWFYEPQKFEFEGIRSGTVFYTPDFKVVYETKYVEEVLKEGYLWHEVKGHLQQKDVTKFRRMAKYHPDQKIILVMQNIPKKPTKKNAEKLRRLDNAKKYVERIIEAEKILKQVGI